MRNILRSNSAPWVIPARHPSLLRQDEDDLRFAFSLVARQYTLRLLEAEVFSNTWSGGRLVVRPPRRFRSKVCVCRMRRFSCISICLQRLSRATSARTAGRHALLCKRAATAPSACISRARLDFCPTHRSFEVICRAILDRDTCVACMPGLAA